MHDTLSKLYITHLSVLPLLSPGDKLQPDAHSSMLNDLCTVKRKHFSSTVRSHASDSDRHCPKAQRCTPDNILAERLLCRPICPYLCNHTTSL